MNDETVSVEFTLRQLDAVLEVLAKEQEQYSVEFAPERIIAIRDAMQSAVTAMGSAFNSK